MTKEKTSSGKKKRNRLQQPVDPVEADRELQADSHAKNVIVDEPVQQQVDLYAQNVIVDEEDKEEQVARRQAKGKGPVLERTDTDTRIDVGQSHPVGEQTMARFFSELESLKKANAEIQRANYEKDLRIPEKMILADVEPANVSKAPEVPREIEAPQKDERSNKPWKRKLRFPFKPKKSNPEAREKASRSLKRQVRTARS
ncbi:hypothetical protein R1sor_019933 [Riccia sorocarpa]|uniref:Uncharacterized protein n=1 Tax=Riccia sorocarpa TaxID=122646 RepID=A0ABD3IF18_9MARC